MRTRLAYTLLVLPLMLTACSQHESTPVVSAPSVTTQPSEASQKNWVDRRSDATWDVVKEPAGWFKSSPKSATPAKKTPAPAVPSQPVEIIIAPQNPGVIVTDAPASPATQP